MPELPDVEVYKKYFDSTSLHKKISDIKILDQKTKFPPKIEERLKGYEFDSTERHGKYLFAKINKYWLVFHFGMTGFLKYLKNETEMPDHVRLLIEFDNNYSLAYDSQRKLGSIELIEDKDEFIEKQNLGPDALNDLNENDFLQLFSKKRGSVKSALMDQELIAGIGNIYSDEILFQACIYPKTDIRHLQEKQLKNLYEMTNKVLKTAIESKVDPDQFPDSFLLSHRQEGEKCPKCEGEIKKDKISGRGFYFCQKHQKKKN